MVIQRIWKNASNVPTSQEPNQQPPQATTPHHSGSSDDSSSSWKTMSMHSTNGSSDSAVGTAVGGHSTSTTSDAMGNWDAGKSTVKPLNKDISVTTVTATVKSYISNPEMAESVHRALKDRYGGVPQPQRHDHAAIRSVELMRGCVQDMFNEELDAIVRRYIDNYFKPALKNITDNLGEDVISQKDCIQSISHALVDTARLQYAHIEVTPPIISATVASVPAGPTGRAQYQRINNPLKRKIDPPAGGVRSAAARRPSLSATNQPASTAGHYLHVNTATVAAPSVGQRSPGNGQPGRTKQVFWNVSQLNADTLFVLDFRANRALGFGELGKERLASRHPELIRYLPDGPDKEWLHAQRIITAAQRANRFLLLVHAEVERVAQSDAHRVTRDRAATATVMAGLQGFLVPDFMLQKMKVFFTELSLRSQSVVANGSGMASQVGAQQPSNQQQQQQQQQQTEQQQHQIQQQKNPQQQQRQHNQQQKPLDTQPPPVRPQRSALSSSHATLSALLSNSAIAPVASVALGGSSTTAIESAKMSSDHKK